METENKQRFTVEVVLVGIALIGIVGSIITIIANGGLNTAPPVPLPVTQMVSRLVDRAAPNFELATLDGDTIRLSSLRGRVVFINFWATWCEPCKRELPAFEQFMAAQEEGGPTILAVNIGEEGDLISQYLEENSISSIPILLDSEYRAQKAYDADLFPTTYIIDLAGIVRVTHLGEMTLDDLNHYVDEYGGT